MKQIYYIDYITLWSSIYEQTQTNRKRSK